MSNVESKLKEAYAQELRDIRQRMKRYREDAKAIFQMRETAEKLEMAGIPYHVGSTALFVWPDDDIRKDKKHFSELVTRVAQAIQEQPDVHVMSSHYTADFKNSKVYVSMWSVEDCQMIEVEETTTRKVMKPHPACVAALKSLEEVS